jgi:hypothetical protein
VRASGPIQEAARLAEKALTRMLHRNTKRGRMVVMQPAATVDKEKVKGKVQGKVQVTPTSMHCRSKWRCKETEAQQAMRARATAALRLPGMGTRSHAHRPPSHKKISASKPPLLSTRHAHSPEWLASHPRLASSAREGSINEWGAPSAVPTYLVGGPLVLAHHHRAEKHPAEA